ncbi:MAG: hypothetical protein ACP5JJ_05420 [Anaerolineae bacterium]
MENCLLDRSTSRVAGEHCLRSEPLLPALKDVHSDEETRQSLERENRRLVVDFC